MIVHTAAAAGVDPVSLQAATGFDAAQARDPEARIPLALEEALWEEAARRSGDEAFGLHAAEALRPGTFDIIDYVVRTAPTTRVAFERLAQYNRLEHDAAVFTLIEQGEVMRIEHTLQIPGAMPCRHASEFTLASLIVLGGQITGETFLPRAVELCHPAPSSWAEHVRVFGVKPRFSADVNALEIATAMLDLPVPAADPALSKVIVRHAEALLAVRPALVESMAQRVRRLLASALGEGDASLGRVAAELRMSQRSLQRRLADEGLSFDAVLDELRCELALQYLADPKLAIAEIAYLLGYSAPSPFYRAFKRWTGMTPSLARRRVA